MLYYNYFLFLSLCLTPFRQHLPADSHHWQVLLLVGGKHLGDTATLHNTKEQKAHHQAALAHYTGCEGIYHRHIVRSRRHIGAHAVNTLTFRHVHKNPEETRSQICVNINIHICTHTTTHAHSWHSLLSKQWANPTMSAKTPYPDWLLC